MKFSDLEVGTFFIYEAMGFVKLDTETARLDEGFEIIRFSPNQPVKI